MELPVLDFGFGGLMVDANNDNEMMMMMMGNVPDHFDLPFISSCSSSSSSSSTSLSSSPHHDDFCGVDEYDDMDLVSSQSQNKYRCMENIPTGATSFLDDIPCWL